MTFKASKSATLIFTVRNSLRKIPENSMTIGEGFRAPGVDASFKMLVLAFLAGFSERVVPNILDRLRKQIH